MCQPGVGHDKDLRLLPGVIVGAVFEDQALGGLVAKLNPQGVLGAEYVALVVGVPHPGMLIGMRLAPFKAAIGPAHHSRLFDELIHGDPLALGLGLNFAQVGLIKRLVIWLIVYRVIRVHLHCLSFCVSSLWADLADRGCLALALGMGPLVFAEPPLCVLTLVGLGLGHDLLGGQPLGNRPLVKSEHSHLAVLVVAVAFHLGVVPGHQCVPYTPTPPHFIAPS